MKTNRWSRGNVSSKSCWVGLYTDDMWQSARWESLCWCSFPCTPCKLCEQAIQDSRSLTIFPNWIRDKCIWLALTRIAFLGRGSLVHKITAVPERYRQEENTLWGRGPVCQHIRMAKKRCCLIFPNKPVTSMMIFWTKELNKSDKLKNKLKKKMSW